MADYTNVLYSSFMPILSASVYDNTGNLYDVSKILTSDFLFDEEAYRRYSRVFLPITYVLSYTVQFASLTALISHTACWHGKDIWLQTKHSFAKPDPPTDTKYEPLLSDNAREATPARKLRRRSSMRSNGSQPGIDRLLTSEDVHNRLMQRYPDVPVWWYLVTGIVTTAVGMFVVE